MRSILAAMLAIVVFPNLSPAAPVEFRISYQGGKVVREFPVGARPVVGLALSGGGARGFAHIGVLDVFEEAGIPIDRIAGTSMGSIVGGLYAAGYSPAAITEIAVNADWGRLFTNDPRRRSIYMTEKETIRWPLLDVRFEGLHARLIPAGLSSGQQIGTMLEWLTLEAGYRCGGDFGHLEIPFRAVATDLTPPGTQVVLDSGNFSRAIQASATVPLLFSPVRWESRLLVDGGLTNNLPVDVVRSMGSDIVIGVVIEESMHSAKELTGPLAVADQTTSILMKQITRLSRGTADLLVIPDMEDFSSRGFDDALPMIDEGRRAARKALPAILDSLDAHNNRTPRLVTEQIEVTPATETARVREVLKSTLLMDEPVPSAIVADAVDAIWDTGRYSSLRAVFTDDGVLSVTVTPLPEVVCLIDKTANDDSTAFHVIRTASNPIPLVMVAAIADSVLRDIKARGASLASITADELSAAGDTLTLRITAPHVKSISFTKGLRSRATIITREFALHEGDVLDLARLMETAENLYGTNLFEQVYAQLVPDDHGVAVEFHLEEKNWSVLRLGMRADETSRAEARVAVSRENIAGTGSELTLVGQAGSLKRLILVENQMDRIYRSFYTVNLKAYSQYRKRPLYPSGRTPVHYEEERYGTLISVGQQMERLGAAVLQFRSETLRTHYAPRVNHRNEKKELRTFIAQTVIDSYDSYPFPKNGAVNVFSLESATEFAGGSEKYVKMYWGGVKVRTFGGKHTISGALSLGSADASTPYLESFTLGGDATRLNCTDGETSRSHFYADFPGLFPEERYGNYLAVGKLAYRLFVPRYFYLRLIYSVGNVWDNNDTINAESVLQGYGIQGSFATYLGPLTFGWGITSEGDDRVSFSAGWEF